MKNILIILFILITGCSTHQPVHEHKLQIKKIKEDLYQHTSYKKYDTYGWVDSNGLIVIKDKQAVIIDTPWSETETAELAQWIKGEGLILIASISTHFHEDRTAGIAWLNKHTIPTYASELTNDILESKNKTKASHQFKDDKVNMFGNLLEVYYPGEGHTEDNLVVWLPEHKYLFGGCLVRSLDWQSLGNTADANISEWANSIKKIQQMYPAIEYVIPGHGTVGDASILTHTINIAEKAATAINKKSHL